MGSSPTLKPDTTLTLSSSPPLQALKPEDRGIRLIQLLLTCAAHASSGNLHRADTCLRYISQLSSVSGDPMQRLSARFAASLAVHLVKRWPGLYRALNHAQSPKPEPDRTRFLFARAFPYLGFAYAVISRTLLQTMSHERVIHILDLGSGDPNLWVPLLQSFANMPRGPPHLKITCVSSDKDVLENLGPKLVKQAEALNIPFQFNPLNASLREITMEMLKVRSGEALALTCVLSLHVLLAEDDCVDTQFGVNKADRVKGSKQVDHFLAMVQYMSPKVLLMVEQESDHNLARLMDRFVEGLYYYSTVFDSVDANSGNLSCAKRLAVEEMFGREIENIVACEGAEREERHERYVRWMVRFGRAGFKPVRLWYDTMEDAKQLVKSFGSNGYKVLGERGSLMICWHERPLYAVSAWHC
ncbi:hypothetical protein HHK36_015522 [Tetracentron sinense]|uniref:Scarecrow-like protein 3 n=1 Tax=Tetracentron sinense TaxID=13715 RepID=A0A834ZBP7_TETSI|nr:hypothetical protein HHK36_015522 [Tetracentron sinense]